MKRILLSFSLALVLMLGIAGPAAAQPTSASGEFGVDLNFESFSFTPRGANCVLEVEGLVHFTGSLEGTATARTTALVFAPCDDVAGAEPGEYRDVFSSTMQFTGTLDGAPVNAGIHYHGTAKEGGQISAVMNFSGGLRGVVQVDGQAGVDGAYSGTIVLK
jgi:hypothetical protein